MRWGPEASTTKPTSPTIADEHKLIDRLRRRPSAWAVAAGAVLLCSWCGNQFSPLLVLYKERQHYSTALVDGFLGIYVLGLIPALLLAGPLSDSHGRRPVMVAGVVAALAASVALAFSGLSLPAIVFGRLLSGIAVGIAMVVGTIWIRELSMRGSGRETKLAASRGTIAFTAGSAIGALVAGAIAQITSYGESGPFLLHILLTSPILLLLTGVPETVTVARRSPSTGSAHRGLRVRGLPMATLIVAPWIFVAPGIAYGYLPVLLAGHTKGWALAYATVLNLSTLLIASAVQRWGDRVQAATGGRGTLVALISIIVGLALAALAWAAGSLALGLLASIPAGVGFGLGLVCGAMDVQRAVDPVDGARASGLFYTAAYSGFIVPTVMAALAPWSTVDGAFALLIAVIALSCLVVTPRPVGRSPRRT